MDTKLGQYVVVGVDGSDSASRAVRWAADEAIGRRAPLRGGHCVRLDRRRRGRTSGTGHALPGHPARTSPAMPWQRRWQPAR